MNTEYITAIEADESINHPDDVFIKAAKQPVRCLCPKCGIRHILKIFWTGSTTPRKYCHKCREAISGVNDQNIYEAVPDLFRIHRGTTIPPGDS